jgi:hypothetical protein
MRALLAVSLVALATAAAAQDARKVPAELVGQAILPAETVVTPPADAPADLRVSGKFAGPGNARTETLGAIAGTSFAHPSSAPRPTGYALPIEGQPLQGLSGIKSMGDGTYWALSDNGFGSKANSPDAMLMLHHLRPDFETGAIEVVETVFLADPNKQVPFRIANEATDSRYLTGSDFDVESIQPVADGFWIGDEFGPYVLKVDRSGAVEQVIETQIDGAPARSPDHPNVLVPATPDGAAQFVVRRSRGYEGMAIAPDGSALYPMLEGPIWDAEAGAWENVDGRTALRILELSTETGEWTGRSWFYPLEDASHAIGDFNMIDADSALVIERDGGEGTGPDVCPEGAPRPDCFGTPARFKRVYRIDFGAPGEAVEKVAYIDLLDIADPDGVARQGTVEGVFTFPFVTIEDVDMVDAETIIVGNDNNFPYSAARGPQVQDDNELVLIRAPELLQ